MLAVLQAAAYCLMETNSSRYVFLYCRIEQWFSTWGPRTPRWSANDFKGTARTKGSVRGPQYRCLLIIMYCILKNNLFVNDIRRIDLFFSSSPIFSVEDRTSEDVKTFFLLFTRFWAKNWTSADVMTFFCCSLDFGQKIGIVFICVDLWGVRNNKLLN